MVEAHFAYSFSIESTFFPNLNCSASIFKGFIVKNVMSLGATLHNTINYQVLAILSLGQKALIKYTIVLALSLSNNVRYQSDKNINLSIQRYLQSPK
jgi:hypothetical protein